MAPEIAPTEVQANLNIVWTLVAGILVFTMQAGFALVETGFTRAKNAANIMMKNLMDFAAGSLAFYVLGAALMFGATKAAGWLGWGGLGMPSLSSGEGVWEWTFFFFQTMFAATAATIVSGAVAERIEFKSYLIYSVLVSALVYPVSGHWMWGGLAGEASAGWLERLGFHDFAGSAVVHSVGGWIALAGALALGPRIGKYRHDGKANPIPGHSLVLGTLGVFLLWIGWFGFNPGSYTEGIGSIGRVAMTTNLAACAGTCAALVTAWIIMGKPDLTMALNGSLAGLVAITAPCDLVTANASIAIGLVAGVLVVLSVFALDRLHIDDPVGAVSVHCVNGVWGTVAVGLFAAPSAAGYGNDMAGLLYGGGLEFLGIQLLGAGATAIWAFGCGTAIFAALRKAGILRVSARTELKGLDITEHGQDAYASFQFFSNI
ncbi:MAG: ammonium transporter [Kiritimatiellae bacterium]|nr:ammonium transporter [Kiritimatiellia bacterium]